MGDQRAIRETSLTVNMLSILDLFHTIFRFCSYN